MTGDPFGSVGTATINAGDDMTRIQFVRSGPNDGPLSGAVTIKGHEIGEINLPAPDGHETLSDYVLFDPEPLLPYSSPDGNTVHVYVNGEFAGGIRIFGPSTGKSSWDNADPQEATPDGAPGDGTDPSSVAGVVNADNPEGAALAPALRRRGVSTQDVGASGTIGGQRFEITAPGEITVGGTTVPVGDIEESDEVARDTETGNVVSEDADTVSGGASGDAKSDGRNVAKAAAVVAVGAIVAAASIIGGD